MNRILAVLVLTCAAACGGSSDSGGSIKNLANFEGVTWNGQITSTVTCTGSAPQSSAATYAVIFSAGTGADLQYTSQAGCVFKFNVSGNTASLANSPVACSSNVGGTPVTLSWTNYAVTTSDGHNLTISAAGSGSASGQTCPFTQTGTAAR
ncbi:MAG: hypothetical protein ACJ79H_18475 [Myxococcales bacterium]